MYMQGYAAISATRMGRGIAAQIPIRPTQLSRDCEGLTQAELQRVYERALRRRVKGGSLRRFVAVMNRLHHAGFRAGDECRESC